MKRLRGWLCKLGLHWGDWEDRTPESFLADYVLRCSGCGEVTDRWRDIR